MADGGSSGIQQATEEIAQTFKEVAVDAKDAVGEAIEQGVQSVVNSQVTPQQIQQKQQEDQRQLAKTRKDIAWYKTIDEEQKKVIEQNKQKEAQRLQAQANTPEVNQGTAQHTSEVNKAKKTPEEVLRLQVERKAGKGLGG